MSKPPRATPPNELVLFFDFAHQRPVPAEPFVYIVSEVARIAKTKRHFGADVLVELVEVSTGSKTIRLSFNQKMLVVGTAIAGGALGINATELGLDLWDRFQGNNRLADCVAQMVLDHELRSTTIITCEGPLDQILPDMMPARRRIEEMRKRPTPVIAATVPRTAWPRLGPEKTVHWIGQFVRDGDWTYRFRREDGREFPVNGVDFESELPVGVRLFVTGGHAMDPRNRDAFYPSKVTRIDS